MPRQHDKDIHSRSFWSGTISFGLVSIPVALFPATRSSKLSLRMLAPDGTPLQRRYYCPREDRLLNNEEIIRGYEYEKNNFVLISDHELEALGPEKSREIDLRRFVPAEQIDPMYFDRAYFLAPTGDTMKAYRLLAEIMEETGLAGVATFVMRSKEYLVAILSENGILRADTLRFADEIRSPKEVGLPDRIGIPDSVIDKINKEIKAAKKEELEPTELEDEETKRLVELIEKKKITGEDIIFLEELIAEENEEGAEIIDIMELLKKSIEEKKRDEELIEAT